ncbi:MAG: type II toxin-antitoxin system ParD family antitoxin [Pseudomonadota bacterium]
MTVKSSISLTDEQDTFARTLVADGRYPSLSAVLQQGLELLRRRTETDDLERDALRALLEARRAGAFVDGADMKRRIDAAADRQRAKHGL